MKTLVFTFTVLTFIVNISFAQLNTENFLKAPFISAGNSQQSMQSILQNSEKDIVFIENLGQIRDSKSNKRPDVLFLTRSQGVDMYITNSGITYVFRKTEGNIKDKAKDIKTNLYRLDMEFVGMNKDIKVKKELAIEQQYNYYTPEYPNGISPKGYKKITIENIYDGIDLVYYEKEGKMKYDFIVKAGADPGNIKMKYKGAGNVYIGKDGSVIVPTPMGEIREEKPYTYSKSTGLEIESRYKVNENVVHFDIAKYNTSEDIIIDPYRIWATYYGGSDNDWGLSICTDNSGNLYVTGWTGSTNFPLQNLPGAYNQTTYGGGGGYYNGADAFILKFNSNGARLWATFYGGSDDDIGEGICLDNTGNIYVTGWTYSYNFPTQILPGAYNQTAHGGGDYDAFILKFNSSGVRLWATFYGGSNTDIGYSICTDNLGALYVTGNTFSINFPKQELLGSYNQTTKGGLSDAFILKFNSSGERLWATYYGGSLSSGYPAHDYGKDICTDNSDNLYITGYTYGKNFPTKFLPGAYNQTTQPGYRSWDVFILKFNSSCERLWATYYGSSNYLFSGGEGICIDNSGNLYVTGWTNGSFPTQFLPGAYNQNTHGGSQYGDAFILKFNSNCARIWATYYGGSGVDWGRSICTDNSGNLYVSGSTTTSNNFPKQELIGAYNQTTYGGGSGYDGGDAFILNFNSSGERLWATYYGGSDHDWGEDICTDNSDNLYVTGRTQSPNFPTQLLTGAYNQNAYGGNCDAFILKFGSPSPTPPQLISPANNAVDQPITPTLTWNAVSGALSYTVQVALDAGFVTKVVDQSGLTNTQHAVPSGILLNNTQYYWRVNATNAGGTGDWSDVWNFTTIIAAPTPPQLISPTNNAVDQPITPTLTWNTVTGALSYTVQVALDAGFVTKVVDQSGLTNTQHAVPSGILLNNTQYFWRVNATNAGGTGDWSDVWNFTTIVAAPTAPQLISPVNNAQGQPLTPTLTWNTVTGAVSYTVQVALDAGFVTKVVDQSGLTNPQHTVPSGILLNNTQCYWRVNATNAGGTGDWSDVWNFTTIIAAPTPPQLISPVNNTQCQQLTPTFTWNAVEGASSYGVQVATDANFTIPLVVDQSGITESQFAIVDSILLHNTQYYWRANATNAGGTSAWSDIWNFTTFNPLSVDAGSDTTIYYGYGDESATLTVTAEGGNGQYSYLWSNEATTQTITVSPTETKTYTVTVTDDCDNSVSDEVTVNVNDVRCGNKNKKVLVCHKGNTICISKNAVQTHLNNHGDYLGNCGDQIEELPKDFELHTNYPNPFNPMTRIDYALPFDSKVSLQIFDILGREVVTLVNDNQRAGYYTVDFNASNLASGIYYYRMIAGDFIAIKKMVVIK